MRFSPAAVAFLLGAITVLGFAPFYFYPLPLLTIAAIAVIWLRASTATRAAALGFAFGLGLFLAGVSWVYVSLHDYGGMPMLLAGVSTLLFCVYLALFPALIGGLLRRLPIAPTLKLVALLPALWALADWARGWIFTGFPWLALGYSQVPASPLAGFAPVFGVYGVSLATAAVAGCLAAIFVRDSTRSGLQSRQRLIAFARDFPVWIGVVIVVAGIGLVSREWTAATSTEPTTVTLIQGNIPQELKWRPERARETLVRYLELTRSTRAQLVVLPETALPMFNVDLPHGYLDALSAHVKAHGGDLLAGVPEYAGPGRYYNSVISLGTSPSQTYRKVHLVPFGDYFPLRGALGWLMKTLDIPMSDFSAGTPDQRPIAVAGQRVAVDICYEDVFGEEIIRQLPEATVLANFTNDAWWGRSIASRQHLQISQMRALETGRSMLRATNTGVTAIIDPRGRVQAAAREFETTVLAGQFHGRSGTTPFIRWGNTGILAIAVVLAAGALATIRRRGA